MRTIKGINIYISRNSKQKFLESNNCVDELYNRFLKNFVLQDFTYINLFLTDLEEESKKKEISGNCLGYYCLFDFSQFRKLTSNVLKKKMLTGLMHSALLELCSIYDFDSLPLKKSYQKCQELEFDNNYYFKNKIFRSPDRKNYVGLNIINDIGKYEIYEVLFDHQKNEKGRRLCFKDDMSVFRIESLKWEDNNLAFSYKFKGPQKIFKSSIEDVENRIECNYLNLDTSSFFK